MDPVSCFIKDGIYKLKSMSLDTVFLCTSCAQTNLGKLCQFKKDENGNYFSTGVTYFLNYYKDNDIKSLFLNRQNYEMIGMIGNNFILKTSTMLVKKEGNYA